MTMVKKETASLCPLSWSSGLTAEEPCWKVLLTPLLVFIKNNRSGWGVEKREVLLWSQMTNLKDNHSKRRKNKYRKTSNNEILNSSAVTYVSASRWLVEESFTRNSKSPNRKRGNSYEQKCQKRRLTDQ